METLFAGSTSKLEKPPSGENVLIQDRKSTSKSHLWVAIYLWFILYTVEAPLATTLAGDQPVTTYRIVTKAL